MILLSKTAEAQLVSYMGDGNKVLILCTHPEGFKGCYGYIAGIADSMAGGNPVGGKRACIQKEVTAGQLVDVTVNYLTQNPAERHVMGSHLVAAALAQAFPCRVPPSLSK